MNRRDFVFALPAAAAFVARPSFAVTPLITVYRSPT
jgi:hypothetical protein